MKRLVKYHNEVNKIPLRNFNEKEINLFFSILYKVKDKGTNKINIDFIDLKKIALTGREDKRLINSLKKMNYKLLDLKQEITLKNGNILMFNLFNTFLFDLENKKVKIEINENFEYMINNLGKGNFTLLELKQLVELKSSYSKNVFRLMKQWESARKFEIKIEEFKRILCIPKSYRMRDIDKVVLSKVLNELTPVFPNLKLEKVKKGRSISKLIFTWGAKKISNKKEEPEVLEVSEELMRAIEKAKKNRFIKPLLTNTNIIKLVKKYSDDDLRKGLLFASNEIKVEIKSLKYLEKTIDTATEEVELKIVTKKSKPKVIQDVEVKEENEKPLKNEIRTSKSEDLKEFIEEIKKIGKKKIKGADIYIFNAELNGAYSFEEVNEIIKKYGINE